MIRTITDHIGAFVVIFYLRLFLGIVILSVFAGNRHDDAEYAPPAGGMNNLGEIPSCGAPWVCTLYGAAGHDYNKCPACRTNYEHYLTREGIDPALPEPL